MTSTRTSPPIPVVTSIAPLSRERTAWLVDIWGVMHNGVRPYMAAAEACEAFRAQGGNVLLLSNAPRPAASVVEQLDRIGVPRAAYDSVLTSGDASRAMIEAAATAGKRIGHLGPERDLGLYAGLPKPDAPLDEAETVVCTGLFDDEQETPESYAKVLESMVHNGAEMICCNPDLTVERGGRIIYCAGALAMAYEAAGGQVRYAGKPFAPVYDLAMERLAALAGWPVERARVLAIGDGVNTDIEGAAQAGIASVYVASGVHLTPGAILDAATLDELFEDVLARPLAAMTELRW